MRLFYQDPEKFQCLMQMHYDNRSSKISDFSGQSDNLTLLIINKLLRFSMLIVPLLGYRNTNSVRSIKSHQRSNIHIK